LNGAPHKQQQFDPAYLHQNNKPQGHTPCGLLHYIKARESVDKFIKKYQDFNSSGDGVWHRSRLFVFMVLFRAI
jgi:hypothetical protein